MGGGGGLQRCKISDKNCFAEKSAINLGILRATQDNEEKYHVLSTTDKYGGQKKLPILKEQ